MCSGQVPFVSLQGESVAHLLLHRDVTLDYGLRSLTSLGSIGFARNGGGSLVWLGKQCSDICNLVPLCLKWTIWKERNRRTFENMELTREDMAKFFFNTLFDWGGGLLILFLSQISFILLELAHNFCNSLVMMFLPS